MRKPETCNEHSRYSSYRERMIEHLFVGELLKCSWIAGQHRVEVLRAEVDGAGYDLVVELDAIVRHVQLKSSTVDAKTARVDVQKRLKKKPSACVIWIRFDPETLELGPFMWFGGRPGEKLPSLRGLKPSMHTRANKDGVKAERKDLVVLPKGKFTKYDTIGEVCRALFG